MLFIREHFISLSSKLFEISSNYFCHEVIPGNSIDDIYTVSVLKGVIGFYLMYCCPKLFISKKEYRQNFVANL